MNTSLKLLIYEHPAVTPVILDFLQNLKIDGFEYEIEPVVVQTLEQANEMIRVADIALIDIGIAERIHFGVKTFKKFQIPIIFTSALPAHQKLRDNVMLGFISKPQYDLGKMEADLRRFSELALNNRHNLENPEDGAQAFAM